jgi:hypothetical protein
MTPYVQKKILRKHHFEDLPIIFNFLFDCYVYLFNPLDVAGLLYTKINFIKILKEYFSAVILEI